MDQLNGPNKYSSVSAAVTLRVDNRPVKYVEHGLFKTKHWKENHSLACRENTPWSKWLA